MAVSSLKGGPMPELEYLHPEEIEDRSFALIEAELAERGLALPEESAFVTKRVIHATADFDYASALEFSLRAIGAGLAALQSGCSIVTDTSMAMAGINKSALAELGGRVLNFVGDPDVASEAKVRGCTRSAVSMERAAALEGKLIYAIGNAPTALVRLCELLDEGKAETPALIVAVPVGFVNVVEAKELAWSRGLPCIMSRGRKGGSTVAAAICNALVYRTLGKGGGR